MTREVLACLKVIHQVKGTTWRKVVVIQHDRGPRTISGDMQNTGFTQIPFDKYNWATDRIYTKTDSADRFSPSGGSSVHVHPRTMPIAISAARFRESETPAEPAR